MDTHPETSHAETLIHPEALQAELEIKKDAYYEDIKFLKSIGLNVTTRKDEDQRVLLEPESADLIRELRQHVSANGRREGFRAGALTEAQGLSPECAGANPTEEQPGFAESLIQRAQKLTAQRMMTADLVVAELAEQMTYEDLTVEQQAQVSQVQAVTHPKANPAAIATQLLQQHRAHRQGGTSPAQAA